MTNLDLSLTEPIFSQLFVAGHPLFYILWYIFFFKGRIALNPEVLKFILVYYARCAFNRVGK